MQVTRSAVFGSQPKDDRTCADSERETTMTVRMDHVSVVVDDLEAAEAFFVELGLEVEGEAPLEGPSVDGLNAIEGVRTHIAMLRTPDGHGRLELTKFHSPTAVSAGRESTPNTLGLRSVMFEVDDIESVVAGLRAHGGELIGELVHHGDTYRLCYVRGPAGIIVELAEKIA
jgi:catechol 2,3-dioxygenase-like lactoylglutathione lyase family enzyme